MPPNVQLKVAIIEIFFFSKTAHALVQFGAKPRLERRKVLFILFDEINSGRANSGKL